MSTIALHTFVNDVCIECGKRWLDIHDVDLSYVGKHNISCRGEATASEIGQIMAERARRMDQLDAAMGWSKPKSSVQTSEDMDSALRHGAPLRLKREDGWIDQGDGRWMKRVGPFYKNPGYYMWIGAGG